MLQSRISCSSVVAHGAQTHTKCGVEYNVVLERLLFALLLPFPVLGQSSWSSELRLHRLLNMVTTLRSSTLDAYA